MLKNIVTSLLVVFSLLIGGNVFSVYAQDSFQPDIYVPRDNATGSVEESNTIDWRWLLPVLAIPILWILLRRRKDQDQGYDDTMYVGVKGGESRKKKI